jgi:hypothetical protein
MHILLKTLTGPITKWKHILHITKQTDARGEISLQEQQIKKGTRGGKGEAMLTASGLPMMLATALEASARMAEVSTPSRLTLVDTLRHGILGPRRFFLLLVACWLSAPAVAALFLRLCLVAGLLPLSISGD